MANRELLKNWVFDAVKALGGEAQVKDVARHIWENHEAELRKSGDLFYTWQYDMRWAAQHLRRDKRFAPMPGRSNRKWALAV
ncbi:MAG: hypothetical protein WDM86_08900 [Rhizomicrobium sp.]